MRWVATELVGATVAVQNRDTIADSALEQCVAGAVGCANDALNPDGTIRPFPSARPNPASRAMVNVDFAKKCYAGFLEPHVFLH